MAKAVLEFDLNDPDDRDAHKLMLQASDYSVVLYQICHDLLRGMVRYGAHPTDGRALTEEEHALVQLISDRVYQIINEHGLEV